MSQRINIVLPDSTVKILHRVAGKGQRSRFIADAVMRYAAQNRRRSLRAEVARGARANAERDLAMAEEWFPIEEEAARVKSKRRRTRK